MPTSDPAHRPWWESAVIYQVYPRSYQDSDGNGIGDLPGIERRLDHLAWLGIDAVWLSPIFPSPMADFGYDVADYCDVDPLFGTLADLDRLIAAAHERGLRILLDYVPNHSSDQHPWFQESRSSRSNPRRDWYLWADPAPDGGPPTNWLSMFGGTAWEWDPATGQYYYHAFLPEQPDLNWRNPAVRAAMFDVLRFWLDRGVDGFRVDVLWHLIKDERLRDNPPDPAWIPGPAWGSWPYHALLPVYTSDRPEVHAIAAEMRAVVDEYGDRVLIGEIYLPVERLVAYYGTHPDRPGVHLPFNFQLITLPWQAEVLGAAIESYERHLPNHGWPNWVLGNHDNTRIASRVGDAQARVAAMLLLTLRGTPTLYAGDEIGMTDVDVPEPLRRDPALAVDGRGRDPHRTPMRWDGRPGAGFTSGQPWLPIGDGREPNVADQRRDPRSMLSLHRRLLALRRAEPALAIGDWSPLAASAGLLAYERSVPGRRLAVALDLGGAGADVALSSPGTGEILLSTALDREGEAVTGGVTLRPNEGVILELEGG
jgi:alpha-glucosidase